jgi:hypothetical protein
LEIAGRETDPEQAVRHIWENCPDLVIVTGGEAATGLDLEMVRLVREGLYMRIVEIHVETNTLCLYSGVRQLIHNTGDLAEALACIGGSVNREVQARSSPAMGQPTT